MVFVAGAAAGLIFQRFVGVGSVLRSAGYGYPTRTPIPPTPLPTPHLSAVNIQEADRGELALFILAGQSNMAGVGEVPADAPGPYPHVYLFGNDYRWRVAREPIDDPAGQVDEVSQDLGAGYSPGLAFAAGLVSSDPDLKIGLIPCAKSGSSISQWERNLSDNSLYGSCIKRARAASTMGDLAGILFFQGESETADPVRKPELNPQPHSWAEKFSGLVAAFRDDLGDSKLPVVFAQIGSLNVPEPAPEWEIVQEQQASIQLPGVAMIITEDLALRDELHFTAESYRTIGARFAEAYRDLLSQNEQN